MIQAAFSVVILSLCCTLATIALYKAEYKSRIHIISYQYD